MPDREDKRSTLPSHPMDLTEQGIFKTLEVLKDLKTSTFSMDELTHQLSARIRSTLSAQGVSIWLADDLRTTISMRAYACIDHIDILPKNYFYSLDKPSAIADCLKKNKAQVHKKYQLAENDPRLEVLAKELSAMLLPLRVGSEAFGVFEIIATATTDLDKPKLGYLEILASQIALLLTNHQNLDRLSNQTLLQKQLYEISTKINQAKDYESILKVTVEELCSALNLPSASIHINMATVGNKTGTTRELKS